MRIIKIYYFFFIFLSSVVSAQVPSSKVIQGKIIADSTAVDAVNVVNIATNQATATNANGVFSILVNEGDVLFISAVNLVTLQKRISKEDIKAGFIVIQMAATNIPLKEVIINENTQISAENLRVIPYGQKRYTPAERKLYTARSGLLDRPLNWISGRTAELKKGVIVEQNLRALNRLEYLFEEKYYLETLKIPQDYIKGFQYYCIEDPEFVAALESKNKTLCMFLIIAIAKKYNKITFYEN